MNLREAVSWARRLLAGAGVADAPLEAEILLCHALGLGRAQLYAHLRHPLPPDALRPLLCLVGRRMSRQPLPYIVGRREFYGLDLAVTPAAMIPRQETELLVELALEWLASHPGPRLVVDVGTGCGAIALAVARHAQEEVRVVATEVSPPALALAWHNAHRLGLAGRVQMVLADLLSPLRGPIDLVVANLPYIPTAELASAPPELRWEPRVALDGGPDGLRLVARLLSQLPARLAPGGAALLELAPQQVEQALALARHHLPTARPQLYRDLARLPRALLLHLPPH